MGEGGSHSTHFVPGDYLEVLPRLPLFTLWGPASIWGPGALGMGVRDESIHGVLSGHAGITSSDAWAAALGSVGHC